MHLYAQPVGSLQHLFFIYVSPGIWYFFFLPLEKESRDFLIRRLSHSLSIESFENYSCHTVVILSFKLCNLLLLAFDALLKLAVGKCEIFQPK